MQGLGEEIGQTLEGYLPNVLAAAAILLLGWVVALLVAALVRGAVDRVVRSHPDPDRSEGDARRASVLSGRIAFYLTLTFVAAGAFQALRLQALSQPLDTMLQRFTAFLPQVFGAALLLTIGVLTGGVLRFLVRRALQASNIGERIAERAGLEHHRPVAKSAGDLVFWGTILMFFPAVLGILQLEGLVAPLQTMFNDLLSIVPDVVGAGLILLVGWFLARVVRQVVQTISASTGIDRFGARFGLGPDADARRMSNVLGIVAYALVLIPTVIAAFDALRIEAVSAPATRMLEQVLAAIPLLIAAVALLVLAYWAGRILSGLVTTILTGVGFDQLFTRVGFAPVSEDRSPARIAGQLVFVGLLILAGVEAAEVLGLSALSELAQQFLVFGSRLLVSLAILGVGLYLANLAYAVIPRGRGRMSSMYASAARVAIIVLAGTMALRNTGVADEIVTLAFGITLGSVAVAAAISFGLGARETARRLVESAFPEPTSEPTGSPEHQ